MPQNAVYFLQSAGEWMYPVEIPAVPARGAGEIARLSPAAGRRVSIEVPESWRPLEEPLNIATGIGRPEAADCSIAWRSSPYWTKAPATSDVSLDSVPPDQPLWLFHPRIGEIRLLEAQELPPPLPSRAVAERSFRLVHGRRREALIGVVLWGEERIPIERIGASGEFSLRAPRGHWLVSVLTMDGNEAHWEGDVDASAEGVQQIPLAPMEPLLASLSFEAGSPASGLLVWRAEHASSQATTRDDGTFSLPRLPTGGSIVLCIEREDGAIFERRVSMAASASREGIRLAIPGAPRVHEGGASIITGRVVNTEGQPVAGALLRLGPEAEGASSRRAVAAPVGVREQSTARSDVQGVFELQTIAPVGSYSLIVSADGYATTVAGHLELVREDDRLDVGDVGISRGASIRGRVIGARGDAVPEAVVSVALSGSAGDSGWSRLDRSTRTDDDGRFELDGIPLGFRVEVRAEAPDGSTAFRRLLETELARPIDLRLAPSRLLRVEVRDALGEPVRGAAVDARALPVGLQGRERPMLVWHSITGEEGRTLLSGVDCGPLDMSVAAAEFLRSAVKVAPAECVASEETTVVVALERAVSLVGRVLGRGGVPIAGVGVFRGGMGTETDALGGFRIQVPAFSRSRIRYGREDLGWFDAEIEVGDVDRPLELFIDVAVQPDGTE